MEVSPPDVGAYAPVGRQGGQMVKRGMFLFEMKRSIFPGGEGGDQTFVYSLEGHVPSRPNQQPGILAAYTGRDTECPRLQLCMQYSGSGNKSMNNYMHINNCHEIYKGLSL